jgi:hypothetical protein
VKNENGAATVLLCDSGFSFYPRSPIAFLNLNEEGRIYDGERFKFK